MFRARVATMLTVAVTGLIAVAGVADASAEDPIRPEAGKPVPDQYVVVLAARLTFPLPTIASQLAQVHSELMNAATTGAVLKAVTGSPNRLLHTGVIATPVPSIFFTTTDVAIPGVGTITSPVTVSGRTGNAPANLRVNVDIKHSARGDLTLDLLAPDGSAYPLVTAKESDTSANLAAPYTVDASSEAANGTWRLRVKDVYRATNSGYINSWQLVF